MDSVHRIEYFLFFFNNKKIHQFQLDIQAAPTAADEGFTKLFFLLTKFQKVFKSAKNSFWIVRFKNRKINGGAPFL
jgi:hypothetical protein